MSVRSERSGLQAAATRSDPVRRRGKRCVNPPFQTTIDCIFEPPHSPHAGASARGAQSLPSFQVRYAARSFLPDGSFTGPTQDRPGRGCCRDEGSAMTGTDVTAGPRAWRVTYGLAAARHQGVRVVAWLGVQGPIESTVHGDGRRRSKAMRGPVCKRGRRSG